MSGVGAEIDFVRQRFKLNWYCLYTYEVVMRANLEPNLLGRKPPAVVQSPNKGCIRGITPAGAKAGPNIGRIPFTERPTCTIAEACDAAGFGRTKLYELIGGGELETVTIGRRRLVCVSSLLKRLRPAEL